MKLNILFIVLVMGISQSSPASLLEKNIQDIDKQRLFVLTDIGNEPDDMQSMIRLLLYSNIIDIEGLVATTSVHQKDTVKPEMIEKAISAYGEVRNNLLLHEPGYPSTDLLNSLVSNGPPVYGMNGVGEGKDSLGSRALITALKSEDPRPLWVSVWGGAYTLAQALWEIRNSETSERSCALIEKLRIFTISDQDDTGSWIRSNFENLFFIASPDAYAGATWTAMSEPLEGSNVDVVSNTWLENSIQQGHGPLGALYPDVAFGMEGDTPSWLYVVPNGLNSPENPNWGSWGGRYEHRIPRYENDELWSIPLKNESRPFWTNTDDEYTPRVFANWGRTPTRSEKSYKGNRVTLWRWREDLQNDFAARMDWCTRDYEEANHPPVVLLNTLHEITVRSGEKIVLDASKSYDPDGDALSYLWIYYPEVGSFKGDLFLSKNAELHWPENVAAPPPLIAPAVEKTETIHFIVKVTDKGSPKLTRYARVIVKIEPRIE